MYLKFVQFVNPINHGGTLVSVANRVVGDRAGETAPIIEIDDKHREIAITKKVNGNVVTKVVPIANVACYEPIPAAEMEAFYALHADLRPVEPAKAAPVKASK